MKCLLALLLALPTALTLAACSPAPPDPAETTEPTVETVALDLDAITAAFAEAEASAALFTGYAGRILAGETRQMRVDGEELPYDRVEVADSFDALRALCADSLDDALIETLLETQAAGKYPLFLEYKEDKASPSTLWRFGGYAAQYSLDTCSRTVNTAAELRDGRVAVTVEIVCDELDVSLSHTYTCRRDGERFIFTDEFPLPIELALAAAMG